MFFLLDCKSIGPSTKESDAYGKTLEQLLVSDTNSWVTFALRLNTMHECEPIPLWPNIHYLYKQIIYIFEPMCITTQRWTIIYFQCNGETTNYNLRNSRCCSLLSFAYHYHIEGNPFLAGFSRFDNIYIFFRCAKI